MIRQVRIKSKTGIYHIMFKGMDGRNIFLEDKELLKKYLTNVVKFDNISKKSKCVDRENTLQ